MNRYTLALLMTLVLPAAAWADHDSDGYREYARVVEVTPLYRTVQVSVPHRECYEDLERIDDRGRGRGRGRGRDDRGSSAVPVIAGGVIGGVIGRQFGDGRGRDAMTVLGTIVGAAVANEATRAPRYDDHDDYRRTYYSRARYRTVERCDVAYETRYEERPDGYLVTYEYEGRTFTTRTDTHPGRRIAVDVEVRPVRGG